MKNPVARILFGLVAVLVLSIGLASCVTGGGPTGSIRLENDTAVNLTDVYFSLTSEDTWGPERLGTSTIVPAGSDYTFYNVPAGEYDLKVLFNVQGTWFRNVARIMVYPEQITVMAYDTSTPVEEEEED
ncbi:MAG: hypothetical protein A2087_11510 [Spirochaetes bacterium GWD1_61_31]|nr:MAG: hypothetical protein A2Y37_14740 [Spirochaetes bacterium GWB1_60_80]OHD29320.1 MAG: hypothetical protein A2004_08240 [Spirochaetes bacterium GWC1_61_12]OHD35828.1 MAG: hypothetical protein A2087_11510 [Spirochaetes bacterium GWD1_61_31]OHD46769.1 MAG: hypothetical protein A2Y35_10680 [Spirochaetes bacterium GWE1_60_18]OHD61221.1 MAG: hypothetical protein A2Y32_12975 [Spirochaetes bacterium GWF1_60_12]HAP43021.1 hypothetical protein [Spirochaetaceae bacterium]